MSNHILLLDKPIGLSSNIALQKVKRLFQAKKAGHAGTLDPLATGMLPIFFGEATKFTQYLLDADKTYAVTMQLGVRTNTSDKEGEVVSVREVPALSENAIEKLFAQYRGAQQQIPSMFSALKYQGKPLYEYARAGLTVERAARAIHIFELNFISIENNLVNFIVTCSKGTYVRTLVDDMGEKLGCGAHVTALRRLSMAGFSEKEMYTLEQCEHFIHSHAHSHFLLPMDIVLLHLNVIIDCIKT